MAGSNWRPPTQWVVSPLTSAPGGAPSAAPPAAPAAPPPPATPPDAVAAPAAPPAPPAVAAAPVLPEPFVAATDWVPFLAAFDGTNPMINSCRTASATNGAYRRARVLRVTVTFLPRAAPPATHRPGTAATD